MSLFSTPLSFNFKPLLDAQKNLQTHRFWDNLHQMLILQKGNKIFPIPKRQPCSSPPFYNGILLPNSVLDPILPISSIKFSPGFKFMAVHHDPHNVSIIYLPENNCFSQYCQKVKGNNSIPVILGFEWITAYDIVFITSSSLELYHFPFYILGKDSQTQKKSVSIQMTKQIPIAKVHWYKYDSVSRILLVCSGAKASKLSVIHASIKHRKSDLDLKGLGFSSPIDEILNDSELLVDLISVSHLKLQFYQRHSPRISGSGIDEEVSLLGDLLKSSNQSEKIHPNHSDESQETNKNTAPSSNQSLNSLNGNSSSFVSPSLTNQPDFVSWFTDKSLRLEPYIKNFQFSKNTHKIIDKDTNIHNARYFKPSPFNCFLVRLYGTPCMVHCTPFLFAIYRLAIQPSRSQYLVPIGPFFIPEPSIKPLNLDDMQILLEQYPNRVMLPNSKSLSWSELFSNYGHAFLYQFTVWDNHLLLHCGLDTHIYDISFGRFELGPKMHLETLAKNLSPGNRTSIIPRFVAKPPSESYWQFPWEHSHFQKTTNGDNHSQNMVFVQSVHYKNSNIPTYLQPFQTISSRSLFQKGIFLYPFYFLSKKQLSQCGYSPFSYLESTLFHFDPLACILYLVHRQCAGAPALLFYFLNSLIIAKNQFSLIPAAFSIILSICQQSLIIPHRISSSYLQNPYAILGISKFLANKKKASILQNVQESPGKKTLAQTSFTTSTTNSFKHVSKNLKKNSLSGSSASSKSKKKGSIIRSFTVSNLKQHKSSSNSQTNLSLSHSSSQNLSKVRSKDDSVISISSKSNPFADVFEKLFPRRQRFSTPDQSYVKFPPFDTSLSNSTVSEFCPTNTSCCNEIEGLVDIDKTLSGHVSIVDQTFDQSFIHILSSQLPWYDRLPFLHSRFPIGHMVLFPSDIYRFCIHPLMEYFSSIPAPASIPFTSNLDLSLSDQSIEDRLISASLNDSSSTDIVSSIPSHNSYLISVIVQLLSSIALNNINVPITLLSLLISLLSESKQYFNLLQYVQFHLIPDSLSSALQLFSIKSKYPPANQLSLDMMKRLRAVHVADEIQMLISLKMYKKFGNILTISTKIGKNGAPLMAITLSGDTNGDTSAPVVSNSKLTTTIMYKQQKIVLFSIQKLFDQIIHDFSDDFSTFYNMYQLIIQNKWPLYHDNNIMVCFLGDKSGFSSVRDYFEKNCKVE